MALRAQRAILAGVHRGESGGYGPRFARHPWDRFRRASMLRRPPSAGGRLLMEGELPTVGVPHKCAAHHGRIRLLAGSLGDDAVDDHAAVSAELDYLRVLDLEPLPRRGGLHAPDRRR